MPALLYQDLSGRKQTAKIGLGSPESSGFITVGSGEEDPIRILHADIEPAHVLLTQSPICRPPFVLIAANGSVRVNDAPVHGLRVLRHKDRILLGATEILFLELLCEDATAASGWIGKSCATVNGRSLNEGDEVICCPWCQKVFHRHCWLGLATCVDPCQYPIRRLVKALLASHLTFCRLGEDSSGLGEKCPACRHHEAAPLIKGMEVVYCPHCKTPYHEDCWLVLDQCVKRERYCSFSIHDAIDEHLVWKQAVSTHPA